MIKVNQPRRRIVAEERFAETLGFPSRNHAASSGGNGHSAGSTEDFQLDGSALHAGDAQSYPAIVDLVVTELLQQRVAYLSQT